MGNSSSPNDAGAIIGSIIGAFVIFGIALGLIILYFKFAPPLDTMKQGFAGLASVSGSGLTQTKIPWGTIIPVLLGILSIYYFSIALWFKNTKGLYRSTADSINTLTVIKQATLSSSIDGLAVNDSSICAALTSKPVSKPYDSIITDDTSSLGDGRALVNWRPLTVRLTGYLGGQNGAADGVFSMAFGVDKALALGARGFMFDIDYLDDAPCKPAIVYRDDSGTMRSLHTGSIEDGIKAIAAKAFSRTGGSPNYDPVLIIVYLRRVPPGPTQQTKFFGAIASALTPLAEFHLGQTDRGNFHNCRSESILFTSPIIDYQKKFIVVTNYNTSTLPATSNPKDNLDWWTNARIYQDPSGVSSGLGSVTAAAPSAPGAVSEVGHISHLLRIGSADQAAYIESSRLKFKIAIGSPDYSFTPNEMNTLLNVLGVQCVPLDILTLGAAADHQATVQLRIANPVNAQKLDALSTLTRPSDILSFWTYGGWSRKLIVQPPPSVQGFQDYNGAPVPAPTPIAGFIIPKSVPPKKPSPAMNSNGGLVTIS